MATISIRVIDTLDLSDRYDVVGRAFAAGNRVYLAATDEDPNNCTYGLVEWIVPTGSQRTVEKE